NEGDGSDAGKSLDLRQAQCKDRLFAATRGSMGLACRAGHRSQDRHDRPADGDRSIALRLRSADRRSLETGAGRSGRAARVFGCFGVWALRGWEDVVCFPARGQIGLLAPAIEGAEWTISLRASVSTR